MIRDALIILRKELMNILKDRRTLVATLLVPLLLLPAIFIGMETIESRQRQEAVETTYPVIIRNNDDPKFLDILSSMLRIQLITDTQDLQGDRDEQSEQAVDPLLIDFPQDYAPGEFAEVHIHYNSTSQKSSYAASMVQSALSQYSAFLAAAYLENFEITLDSLYTITSKRFDTAPEQAQGAGFMLMMVPYMILIYVFAGAMSVGMDTTAGEKERGSLAVILVNQISRTSIALGKVGYVVVVGIASSCMTFIGFLLAAKLTGGFGGFTGDEANGAGLALLSAGSLVIFLVTLIVTSILAASIIVLIGSIARTMKEASSYILPVYFIVILMGVFTMNADPSANPMLFLVPFLNTVFMLKGAIIGEGTLMQLLLFLSVDTLIIIVLIYTISRLYNSEKILNTVA